MDKVSLFYHVVSLANLCLNKGLYRLLALGTLELDLVGALGVVKFMAL